MPAAPHLETGAASGSGGTFPEGTATFTFEGQQTWFGSGSEPDLLAATFSGKIQSEEAGPIAGTLSFVIEYRLDGGVAIVAGGRWAMSTDSRDRVAITSQGTIAPGAVLQVSPAGVLITGPTNLSFLTNDRPWPVAANFVAPPDDRRGPRVKGSFPFPSPVTR